MRVSDIKPIFNQRFFSLLVILAVCLPAIDAHSQQGSSAQKSNDEIVTLKAHLVSVDVLVKDKKGKYITDLKDEDFVVYENGVKQKLEFFDPPLIGENKAGHTGPTAPTGPAPAAGRTMNIISLVLDGQTTELTNLKQVREGLLRYAREQVSETDTVALFAVSNGLQMLRPFSQDKANLISTIESAQVMNVAKNLEANQIAAAIEQLRAESNSAGATTLPQSSSATAQGSASARAMITSRVLQQFLKLRSQLSVQQARPIIAALAAICEAQREIPGKKTLVLFSQGFITSSILDWQVQGAIDIANRANVAIYIIDSGGLGAGAPRSGANIPDSPLGGISATASTDERMRTVGGENVFDHARQEGLNREQDILYRISGDTGGQFIKGTNDIARGLARIDNEIRSRYTLAYHSSTPASDGSFRKLKVEVRTPGASVASRSGYYAMASEDIIPLSLDDKKLLASFASVEANPDLPLFVELSPFRSEEGRYIVPLTIEVPPSAVKFNQKGDKRQMQLDIVGVIRGPQDKIISRLGGSFDVGFNAEQFQAVSNNNIFYRQDMELSAGTYNIELMLRDRSSGKMAARKVNLALPDASAEFSISGVALGRIALPGTARSGDVLSDGAVQIRPSPSREFRPADNLILYFELYNSAKSAEMDKPLVRVTVTVMKDNKTVIKPMDYMLSETVAERAPHLTFAKYISLAGLTAGKYVAIIEAKDMITRKTVRQQESFVITQ